MTKPRKEGHKVVFVETPVELAERLAVIAKRNHRSITGEAIEAFERHCKAEEARARREGGRAE
jgi:hypothetical protein